jgi:uncharacterized protein (TIGR02118 family)
MIKVTILYPNSEGARFDADHYLNVHMPMAIAAFGDQLRGVTVDFGLGGGAPGARAPFRTICTFLFDSVEVFNKLFAAHAGALLADVPNYTDIQMVIQVGEVVLSQ